MFVNLNKFFQFLLEYSLVTMLCEFQLYSKVNQLYIYIHSPLFRSFSHIEHYGVSSSLYYTLGPY